MGIRSLSRIRRQALVCALVAGALAGCGEMTRLARQSAENSGRAARNSDAMKGLSQEAYDDSRSGSSRERRGKELENLARATEIEAKLAPAAAYFSAFEFQLWKETGIESDTETKRENLFTDGVSEFLKTIKDYSNDDRKISVLTEGAQKRTLIALAGALHKTHRRQDEAAAKYGFRVVSMLDLLTEGLQARSAVDSGKATIESVKPHVYEVLKDERGDPEYLLQLRYNLFALKALKAVITKDALLPMLGGQRKTWNPDFSKLSGVAALQSATEAASLAAHAAQLLDSAGIRPELDDSSQLPNPEPGQPPLPATVARLYAAMDPSGVTNAGDQGSARHTKALALAGALTQVAPK